jgi:exonuclease III
LNDTIDLKDLTDIYRVFHPAIAQYTFWLGSHGMFSKIDLILVHKASLNKYKKKKTLNDTLHTVWPQHKKTGTQQQKNQQKIFK